MFRHISLPRSLRMSGEMVRAAVAAWIEDDGPKLGAALAYYTVFSLAPLLIIVIAVAGLFFSEEIAELRILGEIRGLIGPDGAQTIQTLLNSVRGSDAGVVAAWIGVATLVMGATAVFIQLQDALNTIWGVRKPGGSAIKKLIKARLLSFAIVIGVGFLLLVSLAVSAWLAALGEIISSRIAAWSGVLNVLNAVAGFAIITVLFAALFKFLPDRRIEWRDVWLGAIITSFLFSIGKQLIGLYLGRSSVASVFGAAGSLVVIMLWVYYSAQIFFLGAEFTRVFSERRRSDHASYKESRHGSRPAAEGAQ